MKFFVSYQYMPKGASRPLDDGDVIDLEFDSENAGAVILPNVGDYVEIDNSAYKGERVQFRGKVVSRLFSHIGIPKNDKCIITIVVGETDGDWGALMKC